MVEEYRLIGKGNIAKVISSIFLSLAGNPDKRLSYGGINGVCIIQTKDDSNIIIRYCHKGQKLKISGDGTMDLINTLESKLNKKRIRLKPININGS